jgi:hypothetical protein
MPVYSYSAAASHNNIMFGGVAKMLEYLTWILEEEMS